MLPAVLKGTEREHNEKKKKKTVDRLQKFYSNKQVSIATKIQKCINTILQEKGRMAQKNKIGIELYTLWAKRPIDLWHQDRDQRCVYRSRFWWCRHTEVETYWATKAQGTASEDRIPGALLNAKREDFWAIEDYFQALKFDRILLLGFELAWDPVTPLFLLFSPFWNKNNCNCYHIPIHDCILEINNSFPSFVGPQLERNFAPG